MARVTGRIELTAAKIASTDPLLRKVAERVESIAKAEARKVQDTGDYARSISTRRSKKGLDWIVSSSDPASLSIEYGHATRGGRFVPGKHVFGKALGEGRRGLIR